MTGIATKLPMEYPCGHAATDSLSWKVRAASTFCSSFLMWYLKTIWQHRIGLSARYHYSQYTYLLIRTHTHTQTHKLPYKYHHALCKQHLRREQTWISLCGQSFNQGERTKVTRALFIFSCQEIHNKRIQKKIYCLLVQVHSFSFSEFSCSFTIPVTINQSIDWSISQSISQRYGWFVCRANGQNTFQHQRASLCSNEVVPPDGDDKQEYSDELWLPLFLRYFFLLLTSLNQVSWQIRNIYVPRRTSDLMFISGRS